MVIKRRATSIYLREESLDLVLEGEVKGLSREVPDHVRHVPTPEGRETLLLVHPGEAVDNARVPRHLPRLDPGVCILCLDDELHAFDGCRAGLGDGTADTTEGKVDQEVGVFLLRGSHPSFLERLSVGVTPALVHSAHRTEREERALFGKL